MSPKSHNIELGWCIAVLALWYLLKLYVAIPLLDTELYKWEDLISMIPVLVVLFTANIIYWRGYLNIIVTICINLLNWAALVSLADAIYCNSVYVIMDDKVRAERFLDESVFSLALFHSIAVFAVINIIACIAWHVWSRKKMG